MYNKENHKALQKEFWQAFAEAYPKKWLLYNTKIKEVSFKFGLGYKMVFVTFDIECKEAHLRTIYYQKIESLRKLLWDEYLPDAQFEPVFILENGKKISRIWIQAKGLHMNDRSNWQAIFDFFAKTMTQFELFFLEYEDYIRDLELNT